MKKFLSLFVAGILFLSCAHKESSSEAAEPSLIAERVLIGNLFYNFYDNNTAEVTSQNASDPYWSESITAADIPASVTYNDVTYTVTRIGDFAFYKCESLSSVSIPNTVTSIGNYVFRECTGLQYPLYNEHVFAYLPTSYEGTYDIPQGITQIAGGAFEVCQYLTSIAIPNTVTSIGEWAFAGCKGLTSIAIPNSVTDIEEGAFVGCIGFSSVTIPNGVTCIKDKTFYYCTGLTSIIIPKSVQYISDNAFEGCTNLQIVYEE